MQDLSRMKGIIILEMEEGLMKGKEYNFLLTFIHCKIYRRLSLIFRVKSGVKRCYIMGKSKKF